MIGRPLCPICGRRIRNREIREPGEKAPRPCARCRASRPSYIRAVAAFRYAGGIRDAILDFKFRGQHSLAVGLAALLYERLRQEGEIMKGIDSIAHVPLHSLRRRQRGYDQSLLLARAVSRLSGHQLARSPLRRERNTVPQVGLRAAERFRNLSGAFSAAPGGVDENSVFLLVDDVMTTGATVDAAARVLLAAGAREVRIATVARD